jgi:AcrR family transcriptional regulator
LKQPVGTKQKITQVAIELFSKRGFHETSVRDIAKKTGIRVSSLYSHFLSKDEILGAILDWYQTQVNQIRIPSGKLESVIDGIPPKDLLMAGFRRIKAVTGSTLMEKVIRILLMEMYRNSRVREFYLKWYFKENHHSVQRVFQKMAEKGMVRGGSPEALSRLYNALLNHCYLEYFLYKASGEDTSDLERRLYAHMDEIFGLILSS